MAKMKKQPVIKDTMPSILTLVRWRWKQSLFLLLVAGLGILGSTILMSMVPLFSAVTATAGLRSTLATTSQNRELTFDSRLHGLSTSNFAALQQRFHELLQKPLGPYLSKEEEHSFLVPLLTIERPTPRKQGDQMNIFSSPAKQLTTHVTMIGGRLPDDTSEHIEVMVTQESAKQLHLKIGDTIELQLSMLTSAQSRTSTTRPLTMRLVGIFEPAHKEDRFWHSVALQPTPASDWTYYTAVAGEYGLLNTFEQLAREAGQRTMLQTSEIEYHHTYYLNPDAFTPATIPDFNNRAQTVQRTLREAFPTFIDSQKLPPPPYVSKLQLTGSLIPTGEADTILDQFQTQIAIARTPVLLLSLQIVALILIFISMIGQLLVEQQTEAIAVLRSRGASAQQIFGSLATQGIVLYVPALLLGLPLSLSLTIILTQTLLPAQYQSSLSVITTRPFEALLEASPYALIGAALALLSMMLTLRQASRMDVLSVRHETARATQKPFWLRFNLDIIAAIISLFGYGISLYVSGTRNLLNIQVETLLAGPLSLIAPIFLLIACVLIFLRVFPFLLRLGASLARQGRSAAPMLALAQLSRAPGQPLRMTLLLSLATAFAIFTLVFSATNIQHIYDLASYQAEADISGEIKPVAQDIEQMKHTLEAKTREYSALPGIAAASVGYQSNGATAGFNNNVSFLLKAVDPKTFARVAFWPPQASRQPLPELLHIIEQPASSPIPALIDRVMADSLNLSPGSTFTALVDDLNLTLKVAAIVEHIPPAIDALANINNGIQRSTGAILLSYENLSRVYADTTMHQKQEALQQKNEERKQKGQAPIDPSTLAVPPLPVNYVWFKTNDLPEAQQQFQQALAASSHNLLNMKSRDDLLHAINTDPLTLNLFGVLIAGAFTTLLLALLGSLLTTWLSARKRLVNFAVMRALGTSPKQIASVLTWEQAIIYTASVLLGLAFGVLLAFTVAPVLTASTMPTTMIGHFSENELFAIQHLLPPQIVFPNTLPLVLIVLALLCLVALLVMTRLVSKPSLHATLRINED
ncbi:ABC-type lipoprotein release transport system permease subunit [Thermosporothrix hazakensis]|jgi:ABC-type antimicrobial peptide transport system permease subunit|uniref:ABC-type lipoprotein release transport system permease subunit n=2 Tax=Thermosporothrix TaxID=768650 RepID=A0A326U6W6_THEHA|nr:FtsX-like permease family protein [Thermosporothrix hazakensis]PZW26347.1 ABC-type lipoprotein release transport system permease subunit [Thermosporothrix hazakensis]BBH90651.1 hypothetical protein KTC_54020 [Thermosporothrix sp. COM3]GCE48702.1 hypothetical protein KTH_35710 [Thermosporothrix hazakensis]